jgi:hypothetical protein
VVVRERVRKKALPAAVTGKVEAALAKVVVVTRAEMVVAKVIVLSKGRPVAKASRSKVKVKVALKHPKVRPPQTVLRTLVTETTWVKG